MIPNEKINLLRVWRNNLFAGLSISEIMQLSKKNTKTWVFNTLKLFVKKKILNSERKGNLDIYRLNINNPSAIQLLQYIESQENINFSRMKIISEIIEKSPLKFFSLIVFGSYAKKKSTKKSDLDIFLLIDNKDMEKKIKPYINDIKLNTPIKIDEHYITFNEFVEMLLRDEENLGKEIFRKHKLFYNSDIYYQLIKKAHKNGFRP